MNRLIMPIHHDLIMLQLVGPIGLEAVIRAQEEKDPEHSIMNRIGVRMGAHNEPMNTEDWGQLLNPELLFTNGKLTFDQVVRYDRYICEKADRLRANPQHVGSTQSANEALGQYGGSVRFLRWRITVSGLPTWEQDDCVVLVASTMAGIATEEEAYARASDLRCNLFERAIVIGRELSMPPYPKIPPV